MRIKNILLIIAAITIVSCNCARDSEVHKLLQDVKSYIDEKPDSALAVLNGIDKDNMVLQEHKGTIGKMHSNMVSHPF